MILHQTSDDMNKMDLFQNQVDTYIKQTEDGYWKPLEMFLAFIEEVGEIARILNALEGKKKLKGSVEQQKLVLLKEELGDVMFALSCISNYYKIDLVDALEQTMKKFVKRGDQKI